MRTRNLAIASTIVAVGALLTPAALADRPVWFTSWAQSQQNLAPVTLHDQSMRMITHLSQGGSAVRIRVQNTFGRQPLTIDRTTVALSAGGAAVEGTRDVTFGGRRTVTIPAGGEMWSDRTSLTTRPDTDLAVSMHVAGEVVPGRHDSAFRDNYLTPPGSGDHTAGQGAAYTQTVRSTYLVSAVDVLNPRLKGTVVPFGSSVVDGVGSTDCGPGCTELGTNKRWADVLARRITASSGPQLAVANAGISGTTSSVCPNTPAPFVGLDALARLERDVLALHGVTDVIYYYGTNDLANGCTAADIVTSYRAVFQRLREAGIAVHVTPITPRPGYSDQNNVDRHAVNDFVKRGGDCSDTCASVQDFDQVLEDPVEPNSVNAQYDVGDGVHVNIKGQRAIADYIALETIV
ncbi:GDSL-type esterase/lipase family protein [Lentzea sp. BCCO 10_0798]|uniref:GDSL-type esterase/lipase family protein n=1 Tax=Lentzea kristufekii TaxID=3095430 RepID=A0ABU4TNG4_9PSEU|nr:GDSL-type esterase/lipase family protein [Lentzea sp. BCCO 10_0798]MDX8049823.1 GDSL-type esterase/lipase family protein [Lentzea sp. BCCO 10_0798]